MAGSECFVFRQGVTELSHFASRVIEKQYYFRVGGGHSGCGLHNAEGAEANGSSQGCAAGEAH
jgi:hypothetical protein